MRFHDAMRTLAAEGTQVFLEVGPDGVLTAMAQECLTGEPVLVAALRGDRPEELGRHRRRGSAARARREPGLGRTSSPAVVRAVSSCRPMPSSGSATGWTLPRSRWGTRQPSALASVRPSIPCWVPRWRWPHGDGLLLTGRLSVQTHPWLADHVVHGSVLLPGTAFVELAIRAGDRVGCDVVEELVLEAPLVVPERRRAVAPGGGGSRRMSPVGARSPCTPEPRTPADQPWTRHATGVAGHWWITGLD